MEPLNSRTARELLQTVTDELQDLHQGLIAQLSEEVSWLQAEKARLKQDIDTLQTEYRTLQSRQTDALSRQQLAQQQLWAKQMTQVLAQHLQTVLADRLNQVATQRPFPTTHDTEYSNGHSEHAHQLLASLDSTFNTTFQTLERELDSYQSSLSQRLNRMHTLEQQGETILSALIERLKEQLHAELMQPRSPSNGAIGHNGGPSMPSFAPPASNPVVAKASSPQATSPSQQTPGPPPRSAPVPAESSLSESAQFRWGLAMVLLSTLALSFHNVVVRIIGSESAILPWLTGLFGAEPWVIGGALQLNLGNALIMLWMRMLVVVPLMVPVAMFLYPPMWRDLRQLFQSGERRSLVYVGISGISLFLSQVLIYIAIGQIGPSVAVTILFMYPLFTIPMAWLIFKDKPTPLRWIVVGIILLGVILTSLRFQPGQNILGPGVLTAMASGLAFAFYLIFMQLSFKKLHPVPLSLCQFGIGLLLSSLILLLNKPSPDDFGLLELGVQVDHLGGFILGGLLLGVLTLVGYLSNNFGVRFLGAAVASIIAAAGPVVTALMAAIIIQTPISGVQLLGIILVTVGVILLSYERHWKKKPTQA